MLHSSGEKGHPLYATVINEAGRWTHLGRNVVLFSLAKSYVFNVCLITYRKIMSMRAREPRKNGQMYVLCVFTG